MRITDLTLDNRRGVLQAATMLFEGAREFWPHAWPNLESAIKEVHQSFGAERISRVAVEEDGATIGWIGGIRQYHGKVWEVHPLVVRADLRGKGIGRSLVADLEAIVARQGALTLWVASDDETGQTSLFGKDLYPDVLGHLMDLKNLEGHPFGFYLRLGFTLIGCMPDANGPGRPDIYLAKRVAPTDSSTQPSL